LCCKGSQSYCKNLDLVPIAGVTLCATRAVNHTSQKGRNISLGVEIWYPCQSRQSLAGQLALSQVVTTITTTTTTTANELITRYTKRAPFGGHLTHLCSTRYRPRLVGVVIKRKLVTYNHTRCLNKHTVAYEQTNHICIIYEWKMASRPHHASCHWPAFLQKDDHNRSAPVNSTSLHCPY
jgi:hypothetical protein